VRKLLGLLAGAGEAAVRAVGAGEDARAQADALADVAHRPWPPPGRPWVQGQTWADLLFAHWPAEPEVLRPAVPARVPLDTYDGEAWIGITPFVVRGLRPRGAPPPPALSRFAETNVRTYTTIDGRPGIWFLSLDAASRLAVAGARRLYRLPYHHARARVAHDGDRITYRIERSSQEARLSVRYRPAGPVAPPAPGSLEHFLTERYCLYVLDDELRIHRADIHHRPWPLQVAEAEIEQNTMTLPYGIELPGGPPLLHFSARQDVVIWSLSAADD